MNFRFNTNEPSNKMFVTSGKHVSKTMCIFNTKKIFGMFLLNANINTSKRKNIFN